MVADAVQAPPPPPPPPRPTTCRRFGLHRDEVETIFHDPFIVNGYRESGMTAGDCLRSTAVYSCNETINVWTHFIAFLYFFVNFYRRYTTEESLTDPFEWSFVAYSLGSQGFALMSALAHTFNSISPRARNICFSLDYAAISIYAVGAGQSFFFYSRPVDPPADMFRYSVAFSVVSVLLSVASTVQCCFTRQNKTLESLRYVLRTASYVMPFFWNTSPYLYRLLTSRDGFDSTRSTSAAFYFHAVLYIVAAVINVVRVPERYFPGVFCALGQSHHWMHVLTAVGAAVQLEGVRTDMGNRKDVLVRQTDQWYSSYSLLYLLVAVVLNFSVAVWFGYNSTVEGGKCVGEKREIVEKRECVTKKHD